MFAGIDCARNWPTTDMTSARWLGVQPRPVSIGDLVATQDGVYLAPLVEVRVSTPVGGDLLPHVIAWGGRLYLSDGHHRAVRAALNGQQTLDARVLVCQ